MTMMGEEVATAPNTAVSEGAEEARSAPPRSTRPSLLLTNFAVSRAAQEDRLTGTVELVPGLHACASVRTLALRGGTFDPRSIPLLPVWDCDRDESCECGWRASEVVGAVEEKDRAER